MDARLLIHLALKAAALFHRIRQLAETVRQLNAADIKLEALGDTGIVGCRTREGRFDDGALAVGGWRRRFVGFDGVLLPSARRAMGRMQAEAQDLQAEGIVGVSLKEQSHGWGSHVIEFFALGTAIIGGENRDAKIEPPTPVLDLSN